MQNNSDNSEKSFSKTALTIIAIYEFIRDVKIISIPFVDSKQIFSISLFNAAWFYSVPLLIFPFIIILGMLLESKKLSSCSILIPLFKLVSVVSFIGYFSLNFKQIMMELRFRNPQPLVNVIFLVIFLVIDVIIGVLFYRKEGKVCK